MNIECSDEVFRGKNVKLSEAAVSTSSGEKENDKKSSSSSKPSVLVLGKKYDALGCFVKSLELDEMNSSVWFLAGISIEDDDDEGIFEVHHRKYGKQSSFEKSLDIFDF